MILSDTEILRAIDNGLIAIDPFDPQALGGNSYDVTLAPTLLTYKRRLDENRGADRGRLRCWPYLPLDSAEENRTEKIKIGPTGYVIEPGQIYLASTVEYTEANVSTQKKLETIAHDDGEGYHLETYNEQLALVPYLDGKSSVGRLGIGIHATAGRGDVGFRNHWTMELWCAQSVRIYAGMPIGQLTWHTVYGEVERVYDKRTNSAYGKLKRDPLPRSSRMHTQPWAVTARAARVAALTPDDGCSICGAIGTDPHGRDCPRAQLSLLESP